MAREMTYEERRYLEENLSSLQNLETLVSIAMLAGALLTIVILLVFVKDLQSQVKMAIAAIVAGTDAVAVLVLRKIMRKRSDGLRQDLNANIVKQVRGEFVKEREGYFVIKGLRLYLPPDAWARLPRTGVATVDYFPASGYACLVKDMQPFL